MTAARLTPYARLPGRYAGLRVAASTVDARGRVVTLLVPPAATCTRRLPPERRLSYDALVVVSEGTDGVLDEVRLPGLDLHLPYIDALGSGFVLAAARCPMPSGPPAATFEALEREVPHNALVVGRDGVPLRTFHAGDDIRHLLTDAYGGIWTAYGDESCLCAPLLPPRRRDGRPVLAAAPGPGPRTTMSRPGLVRWTGAGEPAWYARNDQPLHWDDCYALNVADDRAWAYPYTGFPLVEVDAEGIRRTRRTPVRGATAILVDGQDGTGVGFVTADTGTARVPGHYTVTLTRDRGGLLGVVASVPLLLPDGSRPGAWARRTVCRGSRMWTQFDDDRTWYGLGL
ncbi:hypothetical protein [Streptomyces sp. NPDC049040]|uniref:hypothetical protein n=1 Tax=Streptomyces sp. NPDC049040 TaxID=3365593 RepID=UPI0037143A2D